MRSESRKRRHSQLLQLIETNPLLTDEEISTKLGVSLSTVRLDRGLLAIPELRERTRAMAEHAASRLKSLRDDEVVGELLGLEPNSWALSTLQINPDMAFRRTDMVGDYYIYAQAASLRAGRFVACRSVLEALDATQTRAAAIVEAAAKQTTQTSVDRRGEWLHGVLQYVESEKACVSFLQSRLNRNESEVDALAAELQRETPTEAKLARVMQLRRAIASDREALKALRTFAAGIERRLAEMLDGAMAEAQKEVLVPIYVAFFEMGVPKTISIEVYNVLVDAVNAALPKPEPKKTEEKEKIEEEETEEEIETEANAEAAHEKENEQGKTKGKGRRRGRGKGKRGNSKEKKQTETGRKWGVVKQQEVKRVDEIQKEIQASRQQ